MRTRRPARPEDRTGGRRPRTQPVRRPAPGRGGPRPRRPVAPGNSVLRLRSALVILGVLLSLFGGRLVQLQGFEGPAYADTAQRGRLRTVELAAGRGAIRDARGAELAVSVDARNVTVDQTLVVDPQKAAKQLAPLLSMPAAELRARLSGNKRFAYLARQVAPETWQQIQALRLPGILGEKTTRRVYPGHDLAANVIGFVGGDGKGLSGLEYALDDELAGKNGEATYEVASGGRRMPLGTVDQQESVPGSDVQLTIDRDIQWMAQQAIARQVRKADAESGTVIVLDVRNGDVLAMATAPTYDANDPAGSKRKDRGNRALSEVYEPGSTGKILTAAAAIEDKVVAVDTPVTVPPVLERADKTFSDSTPHGTLRYTFAGVIAQSSNIGTILATEAMASERLRDYLARFGLGSPTGVGMPESPGILPDAKKWSASQRYTVPFGQGYSVTALQMAAAYATIANDGVRVRPRIVKGTTGPDGTFTPAPSSDTTRVVSANTARQVREMMEAVVSKGGTAPKAGIPGYRIGGKTGTANRVDPKTGRYRGYTASFLGIAPADAPRLVVAVTLQDPVRGHYGGLLGGPVFKEVTSFALSALRIPPTGAEPARLRLTAP